MPSFTARNAAIVSEVCFSILVVRVYHIPDPFSISKYVTATAAAKAKKPAVAVPTAIQAILTRAPEAPASTATRLTAAAFADIA